MDRYKDILKYVNDNFSDIVSTRRYFHSHPELSKKEYNTALKIEEFLHNIGLESTRVGETGVYTEIDSNKPGKIIILRADIDALPILEEHECSYKSQNEGVMHACGHDSHTTSLLYAVKYLVSHKDLFKGKIKVCFQQAEEIGYGAKVFRDLGYINGDRTFGVHVASNLSVGKVALVKGANNASVDWFKITVSGKESHVASPEKGVDALYVASQIVVGIQALVTRLTSPLDNVLVGIGKLNSGTSYNIVAKEAIMEGTIRVLNENIRKMLKEKIEECAKNIAGIYNASAFVIYEDYTSVLLNEEVSTNEAVESGIKLFGKEHIVTERIPSLSGDDFAEFINEVPGCYAYIGSGNDKIKETTVAHHNSIFDIDEECMKYSTGIYIAYAIDYLNNH